jgi:DNA-binding Lrp family transcriptional regulator
MGLDAFVTIKSADGADMGALAQALLKIEGVGEAFELSGGLDILLRVKSDSASEIKAIMEKIKAVDGIKATNSYLIIGERR